MQGFQSYGTPYGRSDRVLHRPPLHLSHSLALNMSKFEVNRAKLCCVISIQEKHFTCKKVLQLILKILNCFTVFNRSPGFDLKFGIAAVLTVKGLELVLKKQNSSSVYVSCSFCASVCCLKKVRVLHSTSWNSLYSFGQRFPQSDSEFKKVHREQQKQNKYKMSKQIKD